MQSKDIKHEFIYINKLTCYFVKDMKPLENMQTSLFMTYPFKFKIHPSKTQLTTHLPQHSSSERQIVNLPFCCVSEGGGGGLLALADKDLVILFYAHDGERRSPTPPPPATRLSPEEATGAPHDSATAHIPVS